MPRGSLVTLPGYHRGRPSPMKGRKFPPTFLTTSDVEALLQAVDAKIEAGRLRGAAIIGVLYRTGITVGEAVDLTLDDVDLLPSRESIHVHHGQTRQGRRLALDAGALSVLSPWHEARKDLDGQHLFCIVEGETTGGRWSTGGVREFLNNTREALASPPSVSILKLSAIACSRNSSSNSGRCPTSSDSSG
jgi:site-specific recombinase XerD